MNGMFFSDEFKKKVHTILFTVPTDTERLEFHIIFKKLNDEIVFQV